MTAGDSVIGLAVVWAVCGVVCSLVWQHRGGSPVSGFLIGALAGIFGLVYVTIASPKTTTTVWNPGAAAIEALNAPRAAYTWQPESASPPATHRECPHCREPMRRDASACPHCQRQSVAWRFDGTRWWAPSDDEVVIAPPPPPATLA
ncbi:MAG: hypothetical protein M3R48_06600 [Candidatus Dormibacteraeota bacterium]|nr:hypothetical protein [Candidatus Dormibacteraeota bacterium]